VTTSRAAPGLLLALLLATACSRAEAPAPGAAPDAGAPPAEAEAVPPTGTAPGRVAVTADTILPVAPAGTPGRPAVPPGAAAETSQHTGTLEASGTAAETVTLLRTEDGLWLVQGPLEADLLALAGARVAVTGEAGGEGQRPTLRVTGYEVLEINGERPWLGRVLPEGRLATGADTLRLRGAVGAAPGALIWITGEREDGTLRVSAFGIIRPAP
jgi:hypothetical protein